MRTTLPERAPSPAPAARRANGVGGPAESTVALRAISCDLARIDAHLRRVEHQVGPLLDGVHPEWTESARNLVRYVALRQLDLRELQILLQQHGLSSLGRSESFVMGSLLEVRLRVAETLLARAGLPASELDEIVERRRSALSWQTAKFLLHGHTHAVFGPKPDGRHVYVMVTAPSAADAGAAWLGRMLRAGMNVLRINCAHEAAAEWGRTLAALAVARRETGLDCRVLMDLGGPKIRTGRIAGGTRVATWKLRRDALGRVLEPAQVVLRPVSRAEVPAAQPVLLLDDDWFADLRPGDVLRFRDTRGKKRQLTVRSVRCDEAVAETRQRAYAVETTRFVHQRRGRTVRHAQTLRIGGPSSAAFPLAPGDRLVLTGRDVAGRAARRDAAGRVLAPALIACSLPEALSRVDVGHRVLFDDGKIEAVVERVKGLDRHLRVRRTSGPSVKLRAEKGINLPDSRLPVSALTAQDRANLAFVGRHADLVGLSFVRSPEDVLALHETLGERAIGIVLKIETKAGFENLPRILLAAMRRPPVAVMIARGDLAVEVGFERLAEVQEEILWLCEASHVPAIWATQVLDTLARSGVPSRAEVTDAAASVAAECVMLNKGPHVEDAVRALVDILRRMEQHHYKKRSIFRKLRVSGFGDAPSAREADPMRPGAALV
jgi:pyruvate kinase